MRFKRGLLCFTFLSLMIGTIFLFPFVMDSVSGIHGEEGLIDEGKGGLEGAGTTGVVSRSLPENLTLSVNRTITVNIFGLVLIEDNYIFNDTRVDGAEAQNVTLILAIRAGDASKLSYTKVFDYETNETAALRLEEEMDNYTYYSFNVTNIGGNTAREIGVWSGFAYYIETSLRGGDQYFALNTSLYPVINAEIFNSTITFELPEGVGEPVWDQTLPVNFTHTAPFTFNGTTANISAFNDTAFYLVYTSNTPIIHYSRVESNLDVSPYGYVHVRDEYWIQTLTPNTDINNRNFQIGEVSIRLPGYAESVTVKDSVGRLADVEPQEVENKTLVVIDFRTPLIVENNSYHLTVTYKYHLSEALENDGNKYRLTTWILSSFNWTIEEFVLKITLPEGASGINPSSDVSSLDLGSFKVDSQPAFLHIGSRPVLKITLKKLLPWHHTTAFQVEYNYSWLNKLKMPLLIILACFGVGLMYVGVRSLAGKTKIGVVVKPTRLEMIPVDILESLTKNYEEKLALKNQVKELGEKARRRKISKASYVKQRRTFEKRIESLQSTLNTVTSQARKYGKRYVEILRTLDLTEAEKDTIEQSIKDLDRRKRERKIKKETYESLKKDLNKRLTRCERTLNKTLLDLREELERRRVK